jgi:hypothetical protein
MPIMKGFYPAVTMKVLGADPTLRIMTLGQKLASVNFRHGALAWKSSNDRFIRGHDRAKLMKPFRIVGKFLSGKVDGGSDRV